MRIDELPIGHVGRFIAGHSQSATRSTASTGDVIVDRHRYHLWFGGHNTRGFAATFEMPGPALHLLIPINLGPVPVLGVEPMMLKTPVGPML